MANSKQFSKFYFSMQKDVIFAVSGAVFLGNRRAEILLTFRKWQIMLGLVNKIHNPGGVYDAQKGIEKSVRITVFILPFNFPTNGNCGSMRRNIFQTAFANALPAQRQPYPFS
jgi:hypothetical protein